MTYTSRLAPYASNRESVVLTAPPSAGTYYYGACVERLSGELDTFNNCSTPVRVTVPQLGDAVVLDLERCVIEPSLYGGAPTVHMTGTVRARRSVSSVTVTGYADGSCVGSDYVGPLSLGAFRSFDVDGFLFGYSGGTVNCRVEADWREYSFSSEPLLRRNSVSGVPAILAR